jgi:hypothetical protein
VGSRKRHSPNARKPEDLPVPGVDLTSVAGCPWWPRGRRLGFLSVRISSVSRSTPTEFRVALFSRGGNGSDCRFVCLEPTCAFFRGMLPKPDAKGDPMSTPFTLNDRFRAGVKAWRPQPVQTSPTLK